MSSINKLLHPILVKLPSSNRWERIWKLAQVDFKKRYYNDQFGLFWALLNPILNVCVYYIAFTYLIPRGGGTDNFVLFLFAGLIFWMEFVQTFKKGIKLIQQKSYLIENVQLRKIDLYYALTLSSFIGFNFNIAAYFFFAIFFDIHYTWELLYLPILVFNLYLFAIGGGMIMAIMYIYFKDILHIMDIIILLGFWGSGIFFDSQIVLNTFAPAYYLNPFLGIIENVRNLILYAQPLNGHIFIINLLYGILILMIGYQLLQRYSYLAIERK